MTKERFQGKWSWVRNKGEFEITELELAGSNYNLFFFSSYFNLFGGETQKSAYKSSSWIYFCFLSLNQRAGIFSYCIPCGKSHPITNWIWLPPNTTKKELDFFRNETESYPAVLAPHLQRPWNSLTFYIRNYLPSFVQAAMRSINFSIILPQSWTLTLIKCFRCQYLDIPIRKSRNLVMKTTWSRITLQDH